MTAKPATTTLDTLRIGVWSLLAGAVAALGRPGIELFPCFFIGIFGVCWVAMRARSFWSAALAGIGFGFAMFSVITVGAVSWGANVFGALLVLAIAIYALPLSLWSYWASRRFSSGWLFIATAAFWSLVQTFQDVIGFPLKGAVISIVMLAPWLLGGVRLVGTDFIDGIVMASIVVAAREVIRSREHWRIALARAAAAVAIGAGGVGALALIARSTAPADIGSIRVGIPQANVPKQYYETRIGVEGASEALWRELGQLLGPLEGVQLLALTETFTGGYDLMLPALRNRWLNHAASKRQAVLLSSSVVLDGGRRANTVAAISNTGQLVGVHRKVNLAPFGESELVAGTRFSPLPALRGASLGALICQEALLAQGPRELSKQGAALLVTTTDDASFYSSAIVFEHMVTAQLRTLETGRAMVWASNSGPSGAFDRWGKPLVRAAFRSPASVRAVVPLYIDTTPFVATELAWPLLSMLVLMVGLFIAPRPTYRPLADAQKKSQLLAVLAFSAVFTGSLLLTVFSPALIELRHGRNDRALTAVGELFSPAPVIARAPPYARFKAELSASEAGALAYFLSFYGTEARADQVLARIGEVSGSGLERARRFLEREGLPVVEIPLAAGEKFPRVATLIQVGGEVRVSTYFGSGPVFVFSPVAASRPPVEMDELLRQAGPRGLVLRYEQR